MNKAYKIKIDKKKKEIPNLRGFEDELNYKLQLFEDHMELLKEYEHKGMFRGIRLG